MARLIARLRASWLPPWLLLILIVALSLQTGNAADAPHSSQDDTAGEGGDQADEAPADPQRPAPSAADLQARYRLASADPESLPFTPPRLPDLGQYTAERMANKVSRVPKGSASVASLLNEPGFKSLTSAIGQGLSELAVRQHGGLRAIFVEHGHQRLADLARSLPAELFEQTSPGIYLARLPILVRHGATLEIGPEVRELRLSQDRGAMLAVEGTLYLHGSRLIGWNEAARRPAWFKSEKEFRPFVVAWGGSHTWIAGSTIAHLGYASTKAFGLSLSQYSTTVAQRAVWQRPTGWILDSEITDLWYGFYTWEADDVVLKGNRLHGNILYGIDPHDRSRRLIIAGNEATGTRRKHGIIISRDVDDSFILGNRSHGNKLSGIVLDRQCSGNVIADNLTYGNGSDGIVLSESPDNLVWNNLSSGNRHHGIRLRNSTGVRIQGSSAIANGLAGIYGVSRDLAGTGRDLHEDPYRKSLSMDIVGGQLTGNGSGPINLDAPDTVALYGIDLRTPQRELGYRFGGALLPFQIEMLDVMVRQKRVAILEPLPLARLEPPSPALRVPVALNPRPSPAIP